MGIATLVIIITLIYGLFMAAAIWLCFKRVNTIRRFFLVWLLSSVIILLFIF